MRCKPGQFAMVMRSVCGNDGAIVKILRQEGDVCFKSFVKSTGAKEKVVRHNVWSVQAVSRPIIDSVRNYHVLKVLFGEDVNGLFPDADLLPLNDPDIEGEIFKDDMKELEKTIRTFHK